jgi:hypothetical protein
MDFSTSGTDGSVAIWCVKSLLWKEDLEMHISTWTPKNHKLHPQFVREAIVWYDEREEGRRGEGREGEGGGGEERREGGRESMDLRGGKY